MFLESIPTTPTEGNWKFLGGREGVLKAKLVDEKYEDKQEFPGGGGGGVRRKPEQFLIVVQTRTGKHTSIRHHSHWCPLT